MIIFKKKGKKFSQDLYDFLFHNIENNLREIGYGDVAVNKKMKDLNKILYDILLKIEEKNDLSEFSLNPFLIIKYFKEIGDSKSEKFNLFKDYFLSFFNFCFDLSLENMIRDVIKFKY